ncbi:indolepyruvate ferredoxin oxidoreductase subunit beta [Candidatus Bathyarchaeota archaeon]|nr:indolepyruvate ferredoxin oxidoreductase subunit beta [Candidatus Bathyarchaeota archaeon]
MSLNVFIGGVGGQGLVLLTRVIGDACARSGIKIITGEMYGLSQRSGAVSVHMRIGDDVFSPLIPVGEADIMIALEAIESLRYIEYLKKDGIVLINKRIMHPPIETSKIVDSKNKIEYFALDQVLSRLNKWTSNIAIVDALKLAKESRNVRTENTVFLGCLSALKIFPIEETQLKQSITDAVPKKTVEMNLKAFDLGRQYAYDSLCTKVACRK